MRPGSRAAQPAVPTIQGKMVKVPRWTHVLSEDNPFDPLLSAAAAPVHGWRGQARPGLLASKGWQGRGGAGGNLRTAPQADRNLLVLPARVRNGPQSLVERHQCRHRPEAH